MSIEELAMLIEIAREKKVNEVSVHDYYKLYEHINPCIAYQQTMKYIELRHQRNTLAEELGK